MTAVGAFKNVPAFAVGSNARGSRSDCCSNASYSSRRRCPSVRTRLADISQNRRFDIFFLLNLIPGISKIGTDIVSPKVADLFSSHTTQTCDACGCEKKKFVAFVVSRYSYFFVHRGAGAVDHGLSILHTKTTLVFRYGADG